MKLLFCPKCFDLFKLNYELKSCECGMCKGRYDPNGGYAVVNGQGLSIAIANPDLVQAMNRMKQGYDVMPVRCWIRPHTGKDNPRTRVEEDLANGSRIK